MVRVLIADDHAILRRGLIEIISDTPDIVVDAEASSGPEALSKVREQRPDLVVLDLNMPGQDGLDVLKQLKAEHEDLPVLVLSMHREDQYAVRVLKAGAAGYLNKESAPEEFVTAIRRIASGGRYVSPEAAESLLAHLATPGDEPLHALLSDREFQVMQLLSSGKTVSEIAEELAISVKTVSTYRSRVLDKMNMRTNAELTHYAITHDLVF